jgi:chloramphenicol-sensitive protein RarD
LIYLEDKKLKNISKGVWFALGAYILWGLFPLYWHLLNNVHAEEILAHRIFWSAIFMLILTWFIFKVKIFPIFKNWKQLKFLIATSILITANWGVYIWAVNNNHIVDASLGYYINPLINVVFGYFFLSERLNKMQKWALILASIGVLYLTIDYGKFPYIALFLAFSFSGYGLLRKMAKINALPALTIETLLITPIALGFLISTFTTSSLKESLDLTTMLLLIGAGPATAIPLFLFGKATETVSLSTLGFIQYLSPTLQLLIGIIIFHEQFTTAHIVCFSFIWAGLLLFSYNFNRDRKLQKIELKLKENSQI